MRGFTGTPVDAGSTAEAPAPHTPTRKPSRWFPESSAALLPNAVLPAAAGAVLPAPMLGRSTPAAKRPKGRFFVGGILLCIFGAGAYGIWNSFLRYDAYGHITGRVIHVPAPQGGNVRALHIREGDHVAQGQLLMTVENLELTQRLARAGDELRIAQGTLDAEVSKLQWQARQQADLAQRAAADYFELWGDMAEQQAKLAELESRYGRDKVLQERGAISLEMLEETQFAFQGQKDRLEKVKVAVAERKKLADASILENDSAQLKPLMLRIEYLQSELSRLRTLIEEGLIRAPVGGQVIRSNYFSGEQVDAASVLLEILEDNSVGGIIYLSQEQASSFKKGQATVICSGPHGGAVPCQVRRFGERYITIPDNLQRYYRQSEQVLPMYVRFEADLLANDRVKLGCEIALPASWNRWFYRADERPIATVPPTRELSLPLPPQAD
ncbi:MAG: HlyD family secretion protein [Pirellulaceae bacterium]